MLRRKRAFLHISWPKNESLDCIIHRRQVLLCTAFNFEQRSVFLEVLEVAELRLEEGGEAVGSHNGPATLEDVSALSIAAALLGAISRLEEQPGVEALRDMATVLLRQCSSPTSEPPPLPDMLADASLMLYMTARPLLDGAFCRQDKEAGLVLNVLRSLHACWEVSHLPGIAINHYVIHTSFLITRERVVCSVDPLMDLPRLATWTTPPPA